MHGRTGGTLSGVTNEGCGDARRVGGRRRGVRGRSPAPYDLGTDARRPTAAGRATRRSGSRRRAPSGGRRGRADGPGDAAPRSRASAASGSGHGARGGAGRSTAAPALLGLGRRPGGARPAASRRRRGRAPPARASGSAGRARCSRRSSRRSSSRRSPATRRGAATARSWPRYGEPAPGPLGLRLPPTPEVARGAPLPRVPPARPRAAPGRARPGRRPRGDRGSSGIGRGRAAAPGDARPRAPYAALRPSRASGRGRRPRWRSGRSATRTRSASATSTCRTSWPGRSPASRAATDERMLELLEPYRGQRARVIRLLELAGDRGRPLRPAPRVAPDRRALASVPSGRPLLPCRAARGTLVPGSPGSRSSQQALRVLAGAPAIPTLATVGPRLECRASHPGAGALPLDRRAIAAEIDGAVRWRRTGDSAGARSACVAAETPRSATTAEAGVSSRIPQGEPYSLSRSRNGTGVERLRPEHARRPPTSRARAAPARRPG